MMIRPWTGFRRQISLIKRFKFLENLSSLLDVKELLSSMTATAASRRLAASPEQGDRGRLDFFVEKSTGSFCGGEGGLRTIVSSPLLIVLAAKGHFVTRSRPRTAAAAATPGAGSRNPGAAPGRTGVYG